MDEFLHRTLRWLRRAILLALGLSLIILGNDSSPRAFSQPVTLALLGDIMLGRGIHASTESFAYLQPYLESADLALANLESPLTDAPPDHISPYVLCAAPQTASLLAQAGLDLLVLANNHNRDCGDEGLGETKTALAHAGLGSIGPEFVPVYREVRSVRMAFLAFDATGDFDLISARQAVRDANRTGAVVIVSMHWGAEYQAGASPGQEQIALDLVQGGADLVWGHHPHVLQLVRWINGTPVIYSLGNALFDQYGLTGVRRSALLLFTVDVDGAKLQNAIPFVIDVKNSRIAKPGVGESSRILRSLGLHAVGK